MKKNLFTFVCGVAFAATLTAADPPTPPVIIGIEHALSEKMLSPQQKKSVLSFFQRDVNVAAVESIDLGNGFSLISDIRDLSGSLLQLNVSAQKWSELTSVNYFLTHLSETVNQIYGMMNDDFDFIFFVLDAPIDEQIKSQLGFLGLNSRVSNNVRGLGVGTHDFSEKWGSQGKLMSVIYLPYYDALSAGPALHEMLHTWGTFICPTFDTGTSLYLGHWGISSANGQAGGFKYHRVVEENYGGEEGKTLYQASRSPETNRDGSFKNGGFGINANDGNGSKYSDIELYLMGLKSEDELRNANFSLDVFSGNEYEAETFANGYFTSKSKRTYTIDDLIARNGKRVPDASDSQKEFKVLTVVISPETAEKSYMVDIMRDINWLAGEVNDATHPHLYNFRQATENRGSLVANNLVASLKTPIIREVEDEMPVEESNDEIIIADLTLQSNDTDNNAEEDEIDAYVYPNPTDGMFTLEYETQNESYLITITDSRGVIVLRRTANEPLVQMTLRGMPSGMYLLTIEDGSTVITKRIVKN